MPFINDNKRTNEPQGIAEALFDPRGSFAAKRGLRQIQPLKVRDLFEKLRPGERIILREECRVVAGVLEDLQAFLVLTAGRLEHEQEHAKPLLHILPRETVKL